MKKVTYFNKFGIECTRHGNIKKTNKHYVLTPSDSTNKIIIPLNPTPKISNCRVRKTQMIYVNDEYIPKPDDPT